MTGKKVKMKTETCAKRDQFAFLEVYDQLTP